MNLSLGHRRGAVAGAVLLLAFVAYLLMNHLMVSMLVEAFGTRGLAKTLVYVAWMTCGFAVLTALLLTLRTAGLTLLFAFALVSVATNYSYDVIGKHEITPDYMEWMVQELGHFGDAWVEFTPEIVASTAKALAGLAVIFIAGVVVRRLNVVGPKIRTTTRMRAGALAGFFAFHGAGMLLQPSYSVAETNVFIFGIPALVTHSSVDRQNVNLRTATAPLAEKIVFVVDESVGPEVYSRVVAPALKPYPVIDFGTAASIAACSAASNALLRWGINVSRVQDATYDPRTNPTIWAYAKAAGFKTVLIDAQSKGAMQNLMNSSEIGLIDEFIPAERGIDTDVGVAELLQRRAASAGREFIYVVKRGSHFPYEKNYPRGLLPATAPQADKYAASVTYATTRFFETLLPIPLSNVLLIYTSDHGQNLETRAPHCSGKNDPREYAVPMIAITAADPLATELRAASGSMRNRASHPNAFATLLYAMGYDKRELEPLYGPTLAGPPGDYIWVDGWLPHPNRRHTSVRFKKTSDCPGCQASTRG